MSFYSLPSTIMHHPTHKQLMAAYSFYNVGRGTALLPLMRDALITAKNVRRRPRLGGWEGCEVITGACGAPLEYAQ